MTDHTEDVRCLAIGCADWVEDRGWCAFHYQAYEMLPHRNEKGRWERPVERGHYLAFPALEVLWDRIDQRGWDECWLWIPHTAHGKPPSVRVGEETRRVARLVWESAYRERVCQAETIDLTCNNNRCCNPKHMRKRKANRRPPYSRNPKRDHATV